MDTQDLTRSEAAAYLRCSLRKIDDLMARREITFRRQGRQILIPRDAADAYRASTIVEAVR